MFLIAMICVDQHIFHQLVKIFTRSVHLNALWRAASSRLKCYDKRSISFKIIFCVLSRLTHLRFTWFDSFLNGNCFCAPHFGIVRFIARYRLIKDTRDAGQKLNENQCHSNVNFQLNWCPFACDVTGRSIGTN